MTYFTLPRCGCVNRWLLISCALFAPFAMYGDAKEEAAYAAAQRFFELHTDNSKVARIVSESSPQLELVASGNDYYVFNRCGASGFVIVDPAAAGGEALLGYSLDGVFDSESPVSAQLQSMLDRYDALAEKPAAVSLYGRYDAVSPLLGEIKWNQEEPYNLDCPVVSGTDLVGNPVERRAPAGCVPTAVGQIMRYHMFPSDYDWNLMLPDYGAVEASDMQKKEVARLMYDIGRGVGARYDVFSTSAYGVNVLPYLTTLGYSAMATYREYEKSNPAAWEPIILEELKAGRPVYMDGVGSNGHAFICDGNDADGYLHINWGWGGMSNGYFNPVLLSPPRQGVGGGDAGYNSLQAIITGLVPDSKSGNSNGSYDFTDFNPSPDGRSFSMSVTEWRTSHQWGIAGTDHPAYECEWGLRVLDAEGDVAADVAAAGTGECTLGEFSLPDGRYRIYPVWRRNSSDVWHYFWPMRGEYPFAEMAVSGGIVSCSRVDVPDSFGVEMSGLVMPELIDPTVSAKLSYTLSCTHGSFGGKIYAVISEQGSGKEFKRVEISSDARTEMIYGQSIWLEVPSVDLFGADVNLERGKSYKVRFETENGNEIYSTDGVKFATHAFPLSDIKDAALRNAVARNSDFNRDGIINDYEILNTSDLNLSNAGLGTLAGIERFFNAVNVIANGNNLTSVDVQGMPEAVCFVLQDNPQLQSIKIRDCGDLDILYAENCALETLSLPENLNMTGGLTLRVSNNRLSSIDVSGIKAFHEFQCDGNLLEELVFPASCTISYLNCKNNRIGKLVLPSDLSELEFLVASGNELTNLELNGVAKLSELFLEGNLLADLEIVDCQSLRIFNVSGNRLASLDLEAPSLQMLNVAGNRLETLNIDAPLLMSLDASDNRLTGMDVTGFKNLKYIDMLDNRMLFFNTPEGVQSQFGGYFSHDFDGDCIDLTPYMAQGMDLAKIQVQFGTELKDNALHLVYPHERKVGYYYDGGYFRIGDDACEVSVDKTELVLPEIGSQTTLSVYDAGNICEGIAFDKNDIIEITDSEYILSDGEYGNICGRRYTMTRIADGDCTVIISALGKEDIKVNVVAAAGVENVEISISPSLDVTGYYDLSGRPLKAPLDNGITIIRMSDGSARKIVR